MATLHCKLFSHYRVAADIGVVLSDDTLECSSFSTTAVTAGCLSIFALSAIESTCSFCDVARSSRIAGSPTSKKILICTQDHLTLKRNLANDFPSQQISHPSSPLPSPSALFSTTPPRSPFSARCSVTPTTALRLPTPRRNSSSRRRPPLPPPPGVAPSSAAPSSLMVLVL